MVIVLSLFSLTGAVTVISAILHSVISHGDEKYDAWIVIDDMLVRVAIVSCVLTVVLAFLLLVTMLAYLPKM